ncbi:hypothetical protein ACSFA2_03550 [Variovorax sp. LT2P21]
MAFLPGGVSEHRTAQAPGQAVGDARTSMSHRDPVLDDLEALDALPSLHQ